MEKPQWSFINSPPGPRQQKMACISNPAQKYEYNSSWFSWENLMFDGSLFTVCMYCAGLAVMRGKGLKVFSGNLFLFVFSAFKKILG